MMGYKKIIEDKIEELESVNKKYFLNDNEQLNNKINILLQIQEEFKNENK